MKLSKIVIAAAVVAAGASSLATSAMAQAKEQFFPLLSYIQVKTSSLSIL